MWQNCFYLTGDSLLERQFPMPRWNDHLQELEEKREGNHNSSNGGTSIYKVISSSRVATKRQCSWSLPPTAADGGCVAGLVLWGEVKSNIPHPSPMISRFVGNLLIVWERLELEEESKLDGFSFNVDDEGMKYTVPSREATAKWRCLCKLVNSVESSLGTGNGVVERLFWGLHRAGRTVLPQSIGKSSWYATSLVDSRGSTLESM